MKAKTKIIALLLAAILIIAAACGPADNPTRRQAPGQANAGAPTENSLISAQDIGEGAKIFRFEVTDGEGNVNAWNVKTDAETVGAALTEVGLIEGTVSDFGLMVTHVNGVRADFVEDAAYWAFYVDGDFAMAGVDSTDIEEGVTYAFVYTPA